MSKALERVVHIFRPAPGVISRRELADAWMEFDVYADIDEWEYEYLNPLAPDVRQFPPDVRDLIIDIAYRHREKLKHEFTMDILRSFNARFRMREHHAIGEGIAIGIKLGLAIARARQTRREPSE